jgi:hypothetical protein
MLSKRVVALARNRGMLPRSTLGLLATPQYWCVSGPICSHPYHAVSYHISCFYPIPSALVICPFTEPETCCLTKYTF